MKVLTVLIPLLGVSRGYAGRSGSLAFLAHHRMHGITFRTGALRRASQGRELPQQELSDHFNEWAVSTLKGGIDVLMHDRPFARFYALETIARVPYFGYLCVLHLQETLGFWRSPELLQVHFSESWNELHHLRIMEALGGNERFIDRFVAQHAAFAYFWLAVALYLANPSFAYNLNQHVEEHAFKTYAAFVREREDWLRDEPVPEIAREYYEANDLYLFDRFHTVNVQGSQARRPKLKSLYDVFVAIRDDELEHAATMRDLVQNGRRALD